MAYKLEEDTTLHFTGGPLKPKGWAIHWWGDPAHNPTFDGIKRLLVNRSAAKSASINFMCEAGRVACLVSPFTIAWGQGDGATGWGNNNLVSVECNPRCSAGDRETLAELIADQNILNDIPIVLYPHNDFNATQCPGTYEEYFPEIIERAKQIVAEKTNGTYEKDNDMGPDTIFISKDGSHVTFSEYLASMDGKIEGLPTFMRNVNAELAAHRTMLLADKNLTKEELLETIKSAVIAVEVKVLNDNESNTP